MRCPVMRARPGRRSFWQYCSPKRKANLPLLLRSKRALSDAKTNPDPSSRPFPINGPQSSALAWLAARPLYETVGPLLDGRIEVSPYTHAGCAPRLPGAAHTHTLQQCITTDERRGEGDNS